MNTKERLRERTAKEATNQGREAGTGTGAGEGSCVVKGASATEPR